MKENMCTVHEYNYRLCQHVVPGYESELNFGVGAWGAMQSPLTTIASSAGHTMPPPPSECLATLDDIDESNYVEYLPMPSAVWRPALFCEATVRHLLASSFESYVSAVRAADCEADLRRRLGKGPPVWIEDKHALPLPDGDGHIERLWFASDGLEYSAKLDGALEGEARQVLWDELASFLPQKKGDEPPGGGGDVEWIAEAAAED